MDFGASIGFRGLHARADSCSRLFEYSVRATFPQIWQVSGLLNNELQELCLNQKSVVNLNSF